MSLTVLGLLLDAIGVVMVFWFAPERHPDPQWSAFFAVERLQPIRKRRVSQGVALILLGFLLQIADEAFRILPGARLSL